MTQTTEIVRSTMRRLAHAPEYDAEIRQEILMDMAEEITTDAYMDLVQKNKSLRCMNFAMMVMIIILFATAVSLKLGV